MLKRGEIIMRWVCWKQSKKNENPWRVEFASLLAMEGSSFGKINDMMTHFWKNLFHRLSLFFFYHRQKCMDYGCIEAIWGKWLVEPLFSSQFHDWELEVLTKFFQKLQACSVQREEDDGSEWKESKDGKLSIKSFYLSLIKGRSKPFTTSYVWNSWVPTKVNIFLLGKHHGAEYWQLSNIKGENGVFRISATCVKKDKESANHLLLHCPTFIILWQLIFLCLVWFVWWIPQWELC